MHPCLSSLRSHISLKCGVQYHQTLYKKKLNYLFFKASTTLIVQAKNATIGASYKSWSFLVTSKMLLRMTMGIVAVTFYQPYKVSKAGSPFAFNFNL